MNFGLSFQYDSLRFPKPYSSADILLMTSKTEVTLSKKLFWNTLIQFSNQRDNLGINSRLQWRFAPLSDLYLVYNDNYFTKDQLRPKFRSINLKLTYWINWQFDLLPFKHSQRLPFIGREMSAEIFLRNPFGSSPFLDGFFK